MVSFWLNTIYDITAAPQFMSEAINNNKREYYKAIINTRLSRNDMTYFSRIYFRNGYKIQSAL